MQGLKAMTLRAPFTKILITNEEWKDYTINLLTLVSAYEGDTITIMWGDAGVANWLITPEQLKNLDFSKVFYSWDSC